MVRSRNTGADGAFKIGGLAPGDYYVVASEVEAGLSGLIPIPQFLASFSADAETVTVTEGSAVRAQPRLVPRAQIAEAIAKLP